MIPITRFQIAPVPLLALMLTLGSCGTTPPSSFYMLAPVSESEARQASAGGHNDVHIGIGPVQFAEYLDRTQIVTRTDNNQVNLADTHRWAEPLQDNFARILAENLSMMVNTDKVSLHPSRNWSDIDYQVVVNVWQFDASRDGKASLVANWSIRTNGGSDLLKMKKSVFITDVEPGASYADITSALSKAVELLSHEIAKAIIETQKR